ncbi:MULTISPECIES: glycoside hydrolase family 3 N-terminal domain-containing protein [unclassified Streptomyces]|uniref:glycoside hydrolase family 3 N-terminal domain-containing protein n=1 Tax=unclassified Streptomyces TaxID=2593676 RepID=UPI002E29AA0B|nr:glycoside hydrolase family 3 N-terminal domain-containing protein [Streptomyces sp. NBC_00223]
MRQPSVPAAAPRPYSVPARRSRRTAGLALGLLVTVTACGTTTQGTPASSSSGTGGAPTTTASATTTSASPSTSASTSASASGSGSAPVPPATRSTSATPSKATPAATCVSRTMSAMSTAQRVGQLFMTSVSTSGMTSAESSALTRGRVGSVFLIGHTSTGTAAVKKVTDRVRALAPSVHGARVGMLISTDQEGGRVQVLNGPGFSTIPSAVTQGTWSTTRLQSSAREWARQLKSAGVNMNLAPVADTVPPDLVNVNAPIGKLDREFGTTPATVASHSDAFLRGMRQEGVAPTIKHFPGLGRVRGNTDLTAGVTDTVTTRNDPFLQPFRSGIQAGTPFVMVSSAIYSKIDPKRQAVFSPTIVTGILRDSLGFKGVIISDDLGQAVAVSDHTPAKRALDFILSGGNIVLTVKPSDIAPMTSAVISGLPHSAALRKAVDDSVRRVLTAKANAGVLTCG